MTSHENVSINNLRIFLPGEHGVNRSSTTVSGSPMAGPLTYKHKCVMKDKSKADANIRDFVMRLGLVRVYVIHAQTKVNDSKHFMFGFIEFVASHVNV